MLLNGVNEEQHPVYGMQHPSRDDNIPAGMFAISPTIYGWELINQISHGSGSGRLRGLEYRF